MEDGADEQADNDQEQHIGDTLAAEDLAEQMGGEDKQTDDGNGQADLSRRAAGRHLLQDVLHRIMMDSVGQRLDGVGDSRQCVGGGYEFGLKHGVGLVEESPVDSYEYFAVAHGVVGGNE